MNWKGTALGACAIVAACNSHDHSGTVPGLPDRPTVVPPFNVAVALTPAAATELRRRGETIEVVAMFYGLANARGTKYGDHMGEIVWSKDEEIELRAPGVARFPSRGLNLALLDYLEDRKPEVLINVVSGRRTSQDNLLECGIFEDSVYLAASKGISITCGLIGQLKTDAG